MNVRASIGALVALISLDVTASLVAKGWTTQTWNIADVSNTTPIVVTTTAPHKVPPGYKMHAVVSGVVGTTAANGTWELTYVDATSFSLATYKRNGASDPSVGNGVYVSGGTIATVLDEGSILLGRKYWHTNGAPPRIVFVPTTAPKFDFVSYGGLTEPLTERPSTLAQMTEEQIAMLEQPQVLTDHQRFEVYVWGAAAKGSPYFADFDVTRALRDQVILSIERECSSPMYTVLGGVWESQVEGDRQAAWMSNGQVYKMLVEILMPVVEDPLSLVPFGIHATITVQPANPGPGDPIVIVTPPPT